jgi:hypothetical protein
MTAEISEIIYARNIFSLTAISLIDYFTSSYLGSGFGRGKNHYICIERNKIIK